ncbi:MAG: zf-TFIIB domain-containing protein [Deltaproteobacteria bacterium]|nr:zf-TFIIB domain-containing protein [Deltaproteobacteria bacterium]
MALEKPSDKESEYFARKEYERLKALAAQQRAKEEAAERERRKELHHMHCPKCGGDLVEISFRSINIDKCTSCEGIWLDAGELELVLKEEDTTVMKRILSVFK